MNSSWSNVLTGMQEMFVNVCKNDYDRILELEQRWLTRDWAVIDPLINISFLSTRLLKNFFWKEVGWKAIY